jgi:uncharacterized hydrophobic protein (TIGR00341 family)
MSLRLIETVLPEKYQKEIEEILREKAVIDIWQEKIEGNLSRMKILVSTGQSEAILDILEKKYAHTQGFRIIILPVEASIPRPKPEEDLQAEDKGLQASKKPVSRFLRISREELYADITKTVSLSWVFVVMVVFSAIVASIGILRNNVVFIIGAMVIAPVLGPNVALSFATTLGDIDLSRRAIKAIGIGILTVLISSFLIGIALEIDPTIPELLSRTQVSLGDVILALAAGSAAALSFTSELYSALIGVMVAVALLPPLVTFGLLTGSGHWKLAFGSMLLFLINLICLNLAGVITFLVQGIRPLTWWESTRAKKAARISIVLWSCLLFVLVVVIFLSQKH